MMVEIVRFDGDWVALVKVQNDLTGNYITSVRQVRGEYGEEFIRYDGRRVNVDKAVERARREEADTRYLREKNKELERFV